MNAMELSKSSYIENTGSELQLRLHGTIEESDGIAFSMIYPLEV